MSGVFEGYDIKGLPSYTPDPTDAVCTIRKVS